MREPSSVTDLVQRCRQGDPEAAGQLFAHYSQRLSRLAEQYLSRRLAGRVEGEDVVQSVFRTFFRRAAEGEFQIDSSAQLWQLLARITVRKARAQGRYHTAAVRDVAAEQPGACDDASLELAAHEPSPEDAAVLMDHIEVLLQGLPSRYCQILELRLQGYSVPDIASRLGVARRTVYRALEVLGQRCLELRRDRRLGRLSGRAKSIGRSRVISHERTRHQADGRKSTVFERREFPESGAGFRARSQLSYGERGEA